MYALKVSRSEGLRVHRIALALGFSLSTLCVSVPAVAQDRAAQNQAESSEKVSVRASSSPVDVLYALPLGLKAPPARTRRVTPSRAGVPAGKVGGVEEAIETGILSSAKVVLSDRALWENNGVGSPRRTGDAVALNKNTSDGGPAGLFARNRVDGDGELRVGPRFIRPRSGALVSPIRRLRNVYRSR